MNNKKLEKEITLLVCTCDAYEDLWYPFFKMLNKYWNNCTLNIILNTETKTYNYEKLRIKSFPQNDNETYGERMIRNLKHIDTKYTLLLLDDFFLRRNVDTEKLEKYLQIMEGDEAIDVIYFTKQILNQSFPSEHEGLEELKKYAMYRLNMQAGLWRTDRLLNFWKPIDNPWKWEIFANYTTFDSAEKFLQVEEDEESPFYYGYNPDGMGVFRGKWVYDDVAPLFKENDIEIDYSIRGIYEKKTEKQYFSDKWDLLKYMLRRMPIKYVMGFLWFYTKKTIIMKIGKSPRCMTHCEYLINHMEE